MNIFLYNLVWMGVNVGLALLGILFSILFLRAKNIFFKIIFFVFWVVFVPNTIYLVTDIHYLPQQITKTNLLFNIFLIIQYLLLIGLGVIAYIVSVYPVVIYFQKIINNKKYIAFLLFLFNFLIAFAVAIGKIQRTESWYIITNPVRVFVDFHKSASIFPLMLFVIIFGLVLNILYFYVIRSFKKDLNKIFK